MSEIEAHAKLTGGRVRSILWCHQEGCSLLIRNEKRGRLCRMIQPMQKSKTAKWERVEEVPLAGKGMRLCAGSNLHDVVYDPLCLICYNTLYSHRCSVCHVERLGASSFPPRLDELSEMAESITKGRRVCHGHAFEFLVYFWFSMSSYPALCSERAVLFLM